MENEISNNSDNGVVLKKYSIALLFIAVLLVGAFIYISPGAINDVISNLTGGKITFGVSQGEKNNEFARINKALDLSKSGNYAEAARIARKIVEEGDPSTPYHQDARSVLETSLFKSPNIEDKVEATRLVKERYLISESAMTRAIIVNKLINLSFARDDEVFEEIFSGDPFELYRDDDKRESNYNLMELSISIDPTSFAVQRLAIRHMDTLMDPSSSVSDRLEAVKGIKEDTTRAAVLFKKERDNYDVHPFSPLDAANFYYWQGFLLGVAASEDTELLVDSEKALKTVFDIYYSALDENDKPQKIVETRLPYTLMRLSMFINDVDGESRREEILGHLRTLISIIEDDEKNHEGSFISFVKNVRDWEDKPGEFSGYDHKVLSNLAGISPEFTTFLKKYGWVL
jgi:hypothetical protein